MATTDARQRGRLPGAESGQRTCPADTRHAILQAARERFLHYGFKKTTVDEIAADAGVGKGSVYLHFDGKDEILLSIVLEVKRNITAQMRTIAASLASPDDKLRRMVSAWILSVHDAYTAAAHGSEVVDDLRPQLSSRPHYRDMFQEEMAAQRAAFAVALEEGNRKGDFDIADPDRTAHLFMTAFRAYFPPYLCAAYPQERTREQLEDDAQEMTTFLLRALERRRH